MLQSEDLRVVVTLGTGKFGSSNNNQITLQGFRTTVDIDKAGGQMMGTLRAQIYGVSQTDMNSITTLRWKTDYTIPNTISVTAIEGTQETLVFQGNIVNAWGNYQAMPDVFLEIQAMSAQQAKMVPVAPRSYKGTIDVSTVMQDIANSMGFAFENNSVSVPLENIYLTNTDLEQAKTVARTAGIDLYVDDTTLAITSRGGPRGNTIPEVSATSGLMGYPTFDGVGVNFQMKFNPAMLFGGQFKLTTELTQAAGQWIASSISYRLEANKPDGAWMMMVRGTPNGLAIYS